MKKPLSVLPALLACSCMFYACSTGRNAVSVSKPSTVVTSNTNEGNSGCYVEMKDGSVQKFGSLQLVTGMFVSPHLLADGKTKLFASQVKSYFNAGQYAVAQENIAAARKSYVAVEALPGFAIRVVKGNINVYRKKFYNGQHAVDEYYVQQGDDGKIVAYSTELMQQLISNNPDASRFFSHKKKKENAGEKLLATVAIYNSNSQVSIR